MTVPTRVYALSSPIPMSLLVPMLNALSSKGWQHEASYMIGMAQQKGGIVSPGGRPHAEPAIQVLLSGLVDDPNDYTLPVINLSV